MRATFSATSSDISLLLTRDEAVGVLKTEGQTQRLLNAESSGFVFHLIGSQSEEYMHVKEPIGEHKNYWITINAKAHEDLIKNGECRAKYKDTSQVAISVSYD